MKRGPREGPDSGGRRRDGAATALATRVLSVAMQFAAAVVAGRMGGASSVGALGAYQSWSRTLGVFASFGLGPQTLRAFSPVASRPGRAAASQWARVATGRVLGLTMLLVVASAAAGALWGEMSVALAWAVIAGGAFFSLARLGALLRQAAGRPESVVVIDFLLPATFLCAAVFALGVREQLRPSTVVAASLVSLALTLIVGAWQLKNVLASLPEVSGGHIARESFGLKGAVRTTIAQLSILAITAIPFALILRNDTAEAAGYFSVGLRLAGLSTIAITAAAASYTPKFAMASAARDSRSLSLLSRKSTIVVSLAYLPVVLACWISPTRTVGVFGFSSDEATSTMLVLVTLQAVNTLTGLSSQRLLMMGGEKEAAAIGLLALFASGVGAAFGSTQSVVFVAWTTGGALVAKNLLELLACRVRLRDFPPGFSSD